MRVLIIEDDEHLRLSLKRGLESEFYTVDHIEDGINGSYIARTHDYQLIIVDYILPGKDGLEIVKELRSKGITSPIMMMSVRGDSDDKINLLESGADDYLVKPFSYGEFRARVHALTRRNYKIVEEVLTIDDLTLDAKRTEVTKDGKKVYLTRKEFLILQSLMRKKGQVVSRGELLEEVWNRETDPFSNTVEAHVRNLRKKLDDPSDTSKKDGVKDSKNSPAFTGRRIIHTVPGRGYKVDEGR